MSGSVSAVDSENTESGRSSDSESAKNSGGEVSEAKHFEDDIIYRLEEKGNGQYLLTMIVNEKFLSNPETRYPVLIDPYIIHGYSEGGMPYNTVFSATSTTWPSYAYEYIQVGYRSGYGEAIGYIQFQNLDKFASINPDSVTRATVITNQTYGGSNSYNVSSYDSNTSVNVNSATYSTLNNNLGARQDTTTCAANDEYGWWITDILKAWLRYERSGVGWNTYQCMIRATTPSTSNSYKQFFCSNSNLYLKVDYNSPTVQTTYSGSRDFTMSWLCTYSGGGSISFLAAKPSKQNIYIVGNQNNSANTLTVSSIDSFGYLNTEPLTANDYTYNIQYVYTNNSIKLNGTAYALQVPPNSPLVSPSWRYDWDIIYPNRKVTLPANSEVRSVGTISSIILNIANPWSYLTTTYSIGS